jgi:hypothetical protein
MRNDFLHRLSEVPELIALVSNERRHDLRAPNAAELLEMIRRPAEASGLRFERHDKTDIPLDSQLSQDAAAQPGVLPLLSFTLDRLYEMDIESRGGTKEIA